ncbi:hypothetical protein J45TS6_36000 [Paenibacillus sp. J45TS6]|nr:hypothetical protein J45TS6_36000 [Paenibacillus sp. J45TS6]
MFFYWVIGFGIISSLIINWSFKKFLNMKPTFDDIMILTLFFLGTYSLIEDLIKAQDFFVSIMCTLTSLLLAFRRYKNIKKISQKA